MKKNGRGEAIELNDEVKDKFENILKEIQTKGCLYGWPTSRVKVESDEESMIAPVVPALTLHEPTWTSDSMLHFVATMGEQGSHPWLHDPETDELSDIGSGAAQAEYRIDFYFPRGGQNGIATFEVIASSDPSRLLRQHLITTGREIRTALQETINSQRKEKKELGEKLGKKEFAWMPVPVFNRIADADRIREIITGAQTTTVRFDQYEPSSRGGEGRIRKRHVAIRLTDELEFDKAVNTIMKWVRILSEDYETRLPPPGSVIQSASGNDDDPDPVKQALSDFASDDLGNNYDAVSIQVTSEVGPPRTFEPNVLREFFTYPISHGKPFNLPYYRVVCAKVDQLRTDRLLPITVPTGDEVHECLSD